MNNDNETLYTSTGKMTKIGKRTMEICYLLEALARDDGVAINGDCLYIEECLFPPRKRLTNECV
ncbi:hypothetical protein V1478_005115 [Vespula squamosa]|uniref:Uncharacterized protein n=1 Tax=Vespula squamosa TaxID=30214 RepID=A0ABD2BD77_VESSQ